MRQLLVLCLLVPSISVAGCPRGESGGTTPSFEDDDDEVVPLPEPEPPPPEPVAVRVRAIHVAAAAAKAPMAVRLAGDEPLSLADGLAFGSSSAYAAAELPPETTEVGLEIEAQGFEASDSPQPVSGGAAHTVIVYSDPEESGTLALAVYTDGSSAPEEGMRVRFFHSVLGWDEVDVCAPGETARAPGEPLFTGATYGGMSSEGYVEVPAETARVQIRVANEDEPCSGRVLGGVDLRPPAGVDPSGSNLTFIGVGRATGRPAVPRALVVCTDAPDPAPTCFRLQMRPR